MSEVNNACSSKASRKYLYESLHDSFNKLEIIMVETNKYHFVVKSEAKKFDTVDDVKTACGGHDLLDLS